MGLGPLNNQKEMETNSARTPNTEVLHNGAGLSTGVPLSEKAPATAPLGWVTAQITLSSDTHTQDLAT